MAALQALPGLLSAGLVATAGIGLCSAQTVAPTHELRLAGYNDMQGMLDAVNALYRQQHPGTAISMSLPGTATGAGALTLGSSDLAPMGAEFSSRELAAYRANTGSDPVRIRVAHGPMNPAARSSVVGIYVNAANPITQLTVDEVARMFTTGSTAGDLTVWSQVSEDKALRDAAIHPCGIAEEEAAGLSPYMQDRLGGRPWAATVTSLLQSRDVVACVAGDRAAIGFGSANIPDPRTKLLMIAATPEGPYIAPADEAIAAGRYPFDRFLYMYLRTVPGRPLSAAAVEYVRLMLSADGQRAMAAPPPGYLPLNDAELMAERKRLEETAGPAGIAATRSPESTPSKDDVRPDGYVLPDGSVRILVDPSTSVAIERLNALVTQLHPGRRFSMQVDPTGFLALAGLTNGIAAFAPMSHAAYPLELRPFLQTRKHAPLDVIVAHYRCTWNGASPLPGLYVNRRAPAFSLTWTQAGRLLTRGSPGGDLTRWEQLGVTGAWAQHAIHIYGPPDDGTFVSALRHASFGGAVLALQYEELPTAEAIAEAVSGDVYGIGLLDKQPARGPGTTTPQHLRWVPLSAAQAVVMDAGVETFPPDSRPDSTPGLRLLSSDLHFYLDRVPGRPFDPVLSEYLAVALSPAGQRALAATPAQSSCSLLPLDPVAIAAQLAQLSAPAAKP